MLLNAFWVPLHFQDTALITIAVPAAVLQLVPNDHVRVFAVIAALVSFISMIVPPIAGALSDRLRRRGVPRRAFILAGAALDVACLVMMAEANSLGLFMTFLLLATLGANVSLAAYQALIPDIVPKPAWGSVSGVRSVAMVLGTVVGIGVAAGTLPSSTFIGIGVAIGLGALTLFGIAERPVPQSESEEPAHISDWHDFTVVFIARGFLAFGLALLMTFVLFFFKDILHVKDPSAGTGLVAAASLLGAIGSGIYLGWLSDRAPRKYVVAACGIPMVLAAAGFALIPQERAMFAFAFLFGIGFGGIMSTGWALAIDSVPKLRDVARDLGIWGIAQNFPAVIAPLAGGWLLAAYGGSLAGYQLLFFAASASFALGSITVLAVGQRPFVPWWGVPLRIAAGLFVSGYMHAAYRIRRWGSLPRERGRTMIVSNHQIELDLMAVLARMVLTGGWRRPVLSPSAKLLHEPGFMAMRIPWMWRFFYNANLGWMFEGLGLPPLENELQTRSIARWAWSVQRMHGVLPLETVFKPVALERFGVSGLTTKDLFRAEHFHHAQNTPVRISELQVVYRKEQFDLMRDGVERDLARIEDALKRGASFYVTPEGEYSTTGEMLPFRGIWDRLLPFTDDVYLAAISYDPFASRRLTQLYRFVRLNDRNEVVPELQAARPVTVSALLCEWLNGRMQPFTKDEAIAAVRERLGTLPAELFVDPELLAAPEARTAKALDVMSSFGVLRRNGDRYVLSERRKHPSFGDVGDIVDFQARFMAQTLAGARRGQQPNAAHPGESTPAGRIEGTVKA